MLKMRKIGFLVVVLIFSLCISSYASTGYIQVSVPNPDIACKPGWCLAYVQNTFGAPALEPNASSAWAHSRYKHFDSDFPDNCYVPIWFSVKGVPEGHVALLTPNGSVYSSSSPNSNFPVRHESIEAMKKYYGDGKLTYLGWTEDIEGLRVVQNVSPMPTTSVRNGGYSITNRGSGQSLNVYNNTLPKSGNELTVYPYMDSDICMRFTVQNTSKGVLIRTGNDAVVLRNH